MIPNIPRRFSAVFYIAAAYLTLVIVMAAFGAAPGFATPGRFLFFHFHVAAFYFPGLLVTGGALVATQRAPRRTMALVWSSPLPFITLALLLQIATGNEKLLGSRALIQAMGMGPALALASLFLVLEGLGVAWICQTFSGEENGLVSLKQIRQTFRGFLQDLGLLDTDLGTARHEVPAGGEEPTLEDRPPMSYPSFPSPPEPALSTEESDDEAVSELIRRALTGTASEPGQKHSSTSSPSPFEGISTALSGESSPVPRKTAAVAAVAAVADFPDIAPQKSAFAPPEDMTLAPEDESPRPVAPHPSLEELQEEEEDPALAYLSDDWQAYRLDQPGENDTIPVEPEGTGFESTLSPVPDSIDEDTILEDASEDTVEESPEVATASVKIPHPSDKPLRLEIIDEEETISTQDPAREEVSAEHKEEHKVSTQSEPEESVIDEVSVEEGVNQTPQESLSAMTAALPEEERDSVGLTEKLAPSDDPVGIVSEPLRPKPRRRRHYEVPVAGVLAEYPDADFASIDDATRRGAAVLEQTLREFKIEAKVTGIRKGPVITMYELLPSPGVKISRIVNLQDNIALRLAASRVRIVAPIPGKHAVGIEVPNKKRATVSFSSLVQSEEFLDTEAAVPVILGKDISGGNQVVDLTRTPHLLIAGATGAGKSVCVNSLVGSILYSRAPQDVKLIMVDPKIVELKLYNDIPHLLTPVITEPKRALQALQWCLCEMERRYSLLDTQGVRDIKTYNKRVKDRKLATEPLPYIVVIVDEFADLMATSGKELEAIVARLAAMSRAVGIHLVLATQRPSVDVITGLIKANFPSRIAFMVAGKTDSRIIIDAMGAEKLLGRGDMLFTSAWDPFPSRIQGAFLAEEEVERLADHVKTLGEPDYIDDEMFFDDDDEEEFQLEAASGDDPMFDKALEIVVSTRKASASYLQRRLKIGYNRAARLVEEMERRGIVGPPNGSKPRDLIHIPERFSSRSTEVSDV